MHCMESTNTHKKIQLLNTGCSKLINCHPRILGIIEFYKCPDLANSIIGYQLLKWRSSTLSLEIPSPTRNIKKSYTFFKKKSETNNCIKI